MINLNNLFQGFKILQNLSLILDSLDNGTQQPNVAPFARSVFKLVPPSLKEPTGTVTEAEFIEALYSVFKLFLKPKSK